MNGEEKNRKLIESHYEPRLRKYRKSYKILDWEDHGSHQRRFQVLADAVELEGKSVLDVGCGLGDLYGFLHSCGVRVEYTGIDLLEKMVEEARRRFPEGRFQQGNIFKDRMYDQGSFGLAYCSGLFNLNLGNNEIFLRDSIKKLLPLVREAVVFNLLDEKSPDRDDRYFYYSPERVEELFASLPVSVRCISGYLPNDFTVVCRKKHHHLSQ